MRVIPLVALLLTAGLAAQTSAPPGVVIRRSVQEVMLDLVVRDKHEKLIRDLKPGDVEVYEDGVKQDIRSFQMISGVESREAEEKAAALAPGAPAKMNPQREINLVLLVFRMMGARERLVAKQAAEDFLKTELRANTYVGVFSLDYRLNALQPFTNNVEALRKSVGVASSGAYREFAKTSDAILSATEMSVSGSAGGVSVSGGEINTRGPVGGVAPADVGTNAGNNIMRAILATDRRVFAGIEGMREIEALKVMVQQLGLLPGRKTVLMMSTGLQLPPDQLEVFRALIGTANRYNVSIYSLDVNGLTTYSSNWANTAVLSAGAAISATQGKTSAVDPGQASQDDILQYGLRAANQQAALAELSEATGGFLIANSNDMRRPLQRIMEDVNTHYELAYSPKSDVFDGHFRKIEVKVLRAGLHVQSRNGYFALPDLNGKPVDPFEVAGLKALEAKPAPREFEYRVSALRFRPSESGWQQAMTFELPTANLASTAIDNAARKRIHASFFALIKDTNGQIVDKISRDIPYTVPADRFEAFRGGNLFFTQPFALPPGRYLVETAVIDRESSKVSTRRISLILPQPGPVAISTVALVRRIDTLKNPADSADPFQFSTSKVTPTLASSIPKGSDTTVYFVVYPSSANPEKPKIVVQYFRDGTEIGRQTPEVADASKDASGAIPMIASAKLEPGQYEVRVTVMQGKDAAQQSASFSIEN